MHGDLLGGKQHVVIHHSRTKQCVGNHGLILRQRLLLRDAGRAQRRDHFSALVNGLNDLNARIPVLMRLAEARKGFNRVRIGVLILPGGLDLRQGDGARLHDHAILRIKIVPGLEDRGVL